MRINCCPLTYRNRGTYRSLFSMRFAHVFIVAVATLISTVKSWPAVPEIVVHPEHTEVIRGGTARLRVVSTGGVEPLRYQWMFNGTNLPGANAAELIIENAVERHEGDYVVDVTNAQASLDQGIVRSFPARLIIRKDSDGDGLSDSFEIGWFRYRLVRGNFTWDEARRDAEKQGGHLGTITSGEELQSIRMVIRGFRACWLGATDSQQEGSWAWITGEQWSYSPWNAGEPNDALGEDYLMDIGNGAWNDFPSSRLLSYLLEIGYPSDPLNPDSDADGLNDGFEHERGLNPIDPDSDDDTFPDLREFQIGTDPKNPDSYPTILSIRRVSIERLLLTLTTKGNHLHLIERSDDLISWFTVSVIVPSNGVGATLVDLGTAGFYRARRLP